MANEANIKAVITAEDKASGVIGKFGGNVDTLGAKMATIFSGVVITNFAKNSISAFEELQNAQAQVTAVLDSTNNAYGYTKKQLEDLAIQLEKNTGFTRDAATEAEALLLPFHNLSHDAIPQLLNVAGDLAIRFGQDLPSVAKGLGRAMQDPANATRILRQYGIDLNSNVRDQIKAFEDSGQIVKAQGLLMDQLKEKVGGASEKYRTTLNYQVQNAKNQFHDFQAEVGKTLSEAIIPLFNFLDKHPETIKIMTDAVLGLAGAFLLLKTRMLITNVADMMIADFARVSGAITSLYSLIGAGAVMGSIVIAGALADIALVMKAVQAVIGALNQMNKTSAAASAAGDAYLASIKSIEDAYKAGKITKAQETKAIASITAGADSLVKRATGGAVNPNQPYLVGEKGAEIFTPSTAGNIIPNNKLGNALNVTFNGIFTGSQMEFRKLAVQLNRALNDANKTGTVWPIS